MSGAWHGCLKTEWSRKVSLRTCRYVKKLWVSEKENNMRSGRLHPLGGWLGGQHRGSDMISKESGRRQVQRNSQFRIGQCWKFIEGFPGSSMAKNLTANAGDSGLIPGSGRSPGRGNGNLFQYSCLEKSHGQRSLASYSPWGHRESDMTEYKSTSFSSWFLSSYLDIFYIQVFSEVYLLKISLST